MGSRCGTSYRLTSRSESRATTPPRSSPSTAPHRALARAGSQRPDRAPPRTALARPARPPAAASRPAAYGAPRQSLGHLHRGPAWSDLTAAVRDCPPAVPRGPHHPVLGVAVDIARVPPAICVEVDRVDTS